MHYQCSNSAWNFIDVHSVFGYHFVIGTPHNQWMPTTYQRIERSKRHDATLLRKTLFNAAQRNTTHRIQRNKGGKVSVAVDLWLAALSCLETTFIVLIAYRRRPAVSTGIFKKVGLWPRNAEKRCYEAYTAFARVITASMTMIIYSIQRTLLHWYPLYNVPHHEQLLLFEL